MSGVYAPCIEKTTPRVGIFGVLPVFRRVARAFRLSEGAGVDKILRYKRFIFLVYFLRMSAIQIDFIPTSYWVNWGFLVEVDSRSGLLAPPQL